MTKIESIESNKQDLYVSLGKSVVGGIPIFGSLLSEIVGTVIPNQRVDRLAKYIKILEDKMALVPEKIISELKKDEHFIDLIEEGFVQASRAITDDRRNYIASILVNGIKDETIAYEESKSLLKILQELNEVEIIWLRYFKDTTFTGDSKFRERHKKVLTKVSVYIGADKETRQKAVIQENYKKHLERLGLIINHLLIDTETKMPKYDKFTGQPKVKSTETTQLGIMLLEQIGLNEEKI